METTRYIAFRFVHSVRQTWHVKEVTEQAVETELRQLNNEAIEAHVVPNEEIAHDRRAKRLHRT